jgi:two-component system sensor histidine kinase BaeS
VSATRRPSLRWVLGASLAAVAVGAVAITAVVTFGLTRIGAERRAAAELGRQADSLTEVASNLPCESGRLRPAQLQRQLGRRVRFVPEGRRFGAIASLPAGEGRTVIAGSDVVYAARAATVCGEPGTLYVFRPVADIESLPQGFGGRLLVAALAALVGSIAVAYALSRRLSRPLGELASSARALARGGAPSLGVSPSDPSEVAEVKHAFDAMAKDLSAAREREKSFLLSVSHELRTPLTGIRGYGEALSDGTARGARKAGLVIVRESRRLERLVQDLIDLARLESGEFSINVVDVDLAVVAKDVAEALRPSAREAGVDLVVDTAGSAVRSDPDRVHQMLANLTENALRVTPGGGTVRITVADRVVAVADSGPGLDPDDIRHAFERFYLWRKYRGDRPVGSGLGLAIVGELAARLEVDVDVSSAPGAGSRFELRFGA